MTFTLRSMLLAFVVVASALGTFGAFGLALGILIVVGVALFRAAGRSLTQCLLAIIILAFLIGLFLPAVPAVREAAHYVRCQNNLKQIALALHNYHHDHGCFPPAYVPGPDGKPWHSWRVLILPYLEQQALYASYRFDEPWDGPNNCKLGANIPTIYTCPSSDTRQSGETNYFAVVGPQTAWPGSKPRNINEIRDGTSNTILLMEAHGLGIHWMEPRDIDFDAIAASEQCYPGILGTFAHRMKRKEFFYTVDGRGIHVAFADGSVHALPWGVTSEALAPLLTADGGEDVDWEEIPRAYTRRFDWPRCLSLAMLVISTLLFWWSMEPRPAATP